MIKWFDQRTLRTKLGLGFAASIGLTLAVGSFAVVSQQRAVLTVESFLEGENRSVELSITCFAQVLEARRFEQEFLVKVREFSYEEARARYANLLRLELADAKNNLDLMLRAASDPQTEREVEQLKRAIDEYQGGFLQIVDLFGQVRGVETGLESQFRAKARAIEALLGSDAPMVLQSDFASVRKAESVLARLDIGGEAAKLDGAVGQFKRDLAAARLTPARTARLLQRVAEYQALFGRYVALETQIDDAMIAHHGAVRRIMPLLEQLQRHAGADAQATHAALVRLNRATWISVIGASLAAIVLALVVAIGLTRNVDRSVRKGADFAGRLARGDLSARVDWTGDAEFGTLVAALNGMADAMQIAGRLEQTQAAALRKVNRTLRVLSQCHCTLVRATSEPELLQSITQQIVETGGYRLVWVGYAQHDERCSVLPVAQAGDDRGKLANLGVTWAGDDPRSGITGAAIREDRTVIARDMTASPQLAAWRGLTRKICLKSGIALPLRGKDGVLGALVIYAEEDAFDDDEVKLLEELANDLAYGIQALREIQARERYEAQLAYQANYDPTTGVANRNLFRDRVDQALLHAARTGTMAATIKLGLDRFGAINDSLGHTAGDELLKHIAQRIGACVHQDDTLARLDGDKFGIAINEMHSEEDVSPIARRLIDAIMQPIVLNGVEIFPSVSMGISIFPRDGENTDRQLQNSRAAMENAKSLGGGQFRYYAPDMNERATARLSLEADLRRALERHEFVLHYQPKASLKNGRLTGAEALVRWQHPTRGRVMPGEFIALAEETGLIEPLGRWVIEQVCTQLHSWCNEGLPVPTVSVNLSARQFRQEDLADFIRDTLRRHDVEPQLLEVELTESTVMHDVDAGIAVLRRLKGIGVKCSLDDFGTGHSSLSYLKRLPIDHLKIDQSFVRDITTDPDNAALCIAIIGLAHSLKLTVVAEGVETPGQMNYLRTHDCDELQGHLFGCAMPAEEFARLLACGRSLALPTTGGSAGTLLIVDDESNILSALRRALRLAGMRILTAGSALEAFEILATNDVQVVISDQRMPQMNGIEFLSRVRDLYPDTVRMVLSGYTDVDSILESINRGTVFRFLTKPWDDALLLEHIDDAFRYHRVASKRQSARATTDNPPLGARPVGDAVSQTGWSPTLVRSDRGDKQQCG